MPAFVKTKEDERLWAKAKGIAEESGHKEDWAYITGIFKKMKGGKVAMKPEYEFKSGPEAKKASPKTTWTVYLFSDSGEVLFEKDFQARDYKDAERQGLRLVKPQLNKHDDADDWVVEEKPAKRAAMDAEDELALRFLLEQDGKTAAGKYDDISFKPPESVANEAAKGLEYRQKASPSNRGGLTPSEANKEGIGSGVSRATTLKNRSNVSPEVIGQMLGFFARHEKNKGVKAEHKNEPWNDKGHVAWLLWGGDAGKTWAEKVKDQMDAADKKSKTAGHPEDFDEWWEYLDPGSQRSVLRKLNIRKPTGWNAREWEKLIDYYVRTHVGDSRGWYRVRNIAATKTSARVKNPFVYDSFGRGQVFNIGFQVPRKQEPLWWTGSGFKDLSRSRNPVIEDFPSAAAAERKIKDELLDFILEWRDFDAEHIRGWSIRSRGKSAKVVEVPGHFHPVKVEPWNDKGNIAALHMTKKQMEQLHEDGKVEVDGEFITYKEAAADVIAALEDACWEGYEAIGMKEQGGRMVPNCVPKTAGRTAKSNAKVLEVPNTFHAVKLEPPKATRKEFPFEGYIDFQGLKIDVENAKGGFRRGTGPEGDWETFMHAHYGEIRGTEGVDGDKLDVYVGDNHDSSLVVVIHQHNPWDGKYDEDKVVLGCESVEEAIGLYKKQYDRPGFYKDGEHTAMPIGAFWRWVNEGRNKGKKVKVAKQAVEMADTPVLAVENRRGYAVLQSGGTVKTLTTALNMHMVRRVPPPGQVPKVRGAVKAFSFHWSNAQGKWDVISAHDFPWGIDGAEFILFVKKTAVSPLGKVWTLPEMKYVAKGLNPHPGAAFAVRAANQNSPWKDEMPGGLADKKKPSDFDPEQLAKGQKVEMEHTNDPHKAREVAMDHLTEDPAYYKKLEKIEKQARPMWKSVSNLNPTALTAASRVSWVRIRSNGQTGEVVARKLPRGWDVQFVAKKDDYNPRNQRGRLKTDQQVLQLYKDHGGYYPSVLIDSEAPSAAPAVDPMAAAEAAWTKFTRNVARYLGGHEKIEAAEMSGQKIIVKPKGKAKVEVSWLLRPDARFGPVLSLMTTGGKEDDQFPNKALRFPSIEDFVADIVARFAVKHAPKEMAAPAAQASITVGEVTSFLRSMSTKTGGRNRDVDYYQPGQNGFREPYWSAEPSYRERLDHYVGSHDDRWEGDDDYDPEGWDENSWNIEYADPLSDEVQKKLDARFGKGMFEVSIGEKGHIGVYATAKGLKALGMSKGKRAMWKQGYTEGKPGAVNAAKVMLSNLLARMRALQWNHLASHWQIGGDASYGDHLLFQRLYEAMGDEVDTLAEKLVGSFGIGAVDQMQQAMLMSFTVKSWSEIGCPFERGLKAERELQAHLRQCRDALDDLGQLNLGMDDYLAATASTHDTHIYLLQQRQGGVKMASATADRKMAERRRVRAVAVRYLLQQGVRSA